MTASKEKGSGDENASILITKETFLSVPIRGKIVLTGNRSRNVKYLNVVYVNKDFSDLFDLFHPEYYFEGIKTCPVNTLHVLNGSYPLKFSHKKPAFIYFKQDKLMIKFA